MFFDEIKLSKKSWHFKLQAYMFGAPPFTNNFCPYFWLTIFCMIVIPFVFLFKSIYKISIITYQQRIIPLLSKMDRLMESLSTNVCEPFIERRYRAFDDLKIYSLKEAIDYQYRYGSIVKWSKFNREFEMWKKSVGDNWIDRLKNIDERFEKIREEKRLKEKQIEEKLLDKKKKDTLKKQNRKKLFAKIANYTKWIVTPIFIICGVSLVLLALYLALWACKSIYSVWTMKFTITTLIALALVAAVIILIVCCAYILPRIANKIERCMIYIPPKKVNPYSKPFIDKIIDCIKRCSAPFEIFIEYIKVFKQNNCPAIVWKEDEKDTYRR